MPGTAAIKLSCRNSAEGFWCKRTRRTLFVKDVLGEESNIPLLSPEGLALTNAHVVNNRETIAVRTTDGNTYSASIISLDVTNDVALLEIDSSDAFSHWLKLGSSSDVALGAEIFVIGYPLAQIMGAAPKVTEGIVSALSGLGDDPTMFQISAPIQPGNSGGPIITPRLEVVGIATKRLSDAYVARATGSLPQNVNFGVKINYAKLLLAPNYNQAKIDSNAVSTDLATAADASVLILAQSARKSKGPLVGPFCFLAESGCG